MINKFLILMFCMILLAGPVLAEDTILKQSSNSDVIVKCINNGVCSSSTVCNVTISDPDNIILVDNQQMTRSTNGGFYNYTLNITETSKLGKYQVGGFCKDGSVSKEIDFFIWVTVTGNLLETSESILYIIILLATFLLFLGFLYPAITLPYSNHIEADGSIRRIVKAKYLKLLSLWFAYGFLMWFLQTLNSISKSFISLDYLSNFITNIFTYSQLFSVAVTFLILTIMFIEAWKDIILSETIKTYGKAIVNADLG